MSFKGIDFSHLLGTKGFSDELLKNHFKLYEGYVKNTNQLYERINKHFSKGDLDSPEFAEMRRRFGWEFNGMRLHEYYFGGMVNGGREIDKNSDLYQKINKRFNGFQRWRKDFESVGAMRGIGWALLCHDPISDGFFNIWIDEHNTGNLAGLSVLLALDVFEHAFILDYGLDKAEYMKSYFNAVNWEVIQSRFEYNEVKPFLLAS